MFINIDDKVLANILNLSANMRKLSANISLAGIPDSSIPGFLQDWGSDSQQVHCLALVPTGLIFILSKGLQLKEGQFNL